MKLNLGGGLGGGNAIGQPENVSNNQKKKVPAIGPLNIGSLKQNQGNDKFDMKLGG